MRRQCLTSPSEPHRKRRLTTERCVSISFTSKMGPGVTRAPAQRAKPLFGPASHLGGCNFRTHCRRGNNAPTSLGMSKTRKQGRTGKRHKVSAPKSKSARHQGSQTAVSKRIETRERALHGQVWLARCCSRGVEGGPTAVSKRIEARERALHGQVWWTQCCRGGGKRCRPRPARAV